MVWLSRRATILSASTLVGSGGEDAGGAPAAGGWQMRCLHVAFAGGRIRAHVDGHLLRLDAAVGVPNLRVAEQQHGLCLRVIMRFVGTRLAVAVAVLEVPGLPDFAQGLRADIKHASRRSAWLSCVVLPAGRWQAG